MKHYIVLGTKVLVVTGLLVAVIILAILLAKCKTRTENCPPPKSVQYMVTETMDDDTYFTYIDDIDAYFNMRDGSSVVLFDNQHSYFEKIIHSEIGTDAFKRVVIGFKRPMLLDDMVTLHALYGILPADWIEGDAPLGGPLSIKLLDTDKKVVSKFEIETMSPLMKTPTPYVADVSKCS